MTKLRPAGFFRELAHGWPNGPSLKVLLHKENYGGEKERIISYIESGLPLAVAPGVSFDVLATEKIISGAIHGLTDGQWEWPADLAYYVYTYDVELPPDFVEHMRRRNWAPPANGEVDFSLLETSYPGEEQSD